MNFHFHEKRKPLTSQGVSNKDSDLLESKEPGWLIIRMSVLFVLVISMFHGSHAQDATAFVMKSQLRLQEPVGQSSGILFEISNESFANWLMSTDLTNGNIVLKTETGSNIFNLTQQGKIGIGILEPSEILDVVGNVKATSFIGDGSQLTGLNFFQISDLNDFWTLNNENPEAPFLRTENSIQMISPQGRLDAMILKTVHNTSNVGLSFKNVSDNYTWSIFKTLSNSANTDWHGDLVFAGNSAAEHYLSSDPDDLNEYMRINAMGNVGIGTNAPSERLEVSGNVKATSFIGDGSQLTGIDAGSLTGQLPSLDGSQLTGIDASQVSNLADQRRNYLLLKNMEEENITLADPEGVLLYDYAYGGPDGPFDALFDDALAGGLLYNHRDNGWSAVISSQNMSELRAVFKTVTSDSFIGDGSQLTGIDAGSLTGQLPSLDGSQLTGIDASQISNLKFTPWISRSEALGYTGSVVINSKNWFPSDHSQYPLQVSMPNSASSVSVIKVVGGSSKISDHAGISFSTMGNWQEVAKSAIYHQQFADGVWGRGDLVFAVNDQGDNSEVGVDDARMRINRFGNVGIGTNSPSERLDVSGNVKATSFIGDGSQLTGISASQISDLQGSEWSEIEDQLRYSGSVGINIQPGFPNDQSNIPLYVKMPNGASSTSVIKVAAGTSKYLDHAGISFATNANWNETPKSAVYHIQTQDAAWGIGDLVFAVNGQVDNTSVGLDDEKMRINRLGNVGIGVQWPSERLEISGNVKATSFIGDGSGITNIDPDQVSGLDARISSVAGSSPWTTADGQIWNTGNVGIGTTAHGLAKLHVDGDIIVGGENTDDGSTAIRGIALNPSTDGIEAIGDITFWGSDWGTENPYLGDRMNLSAKHVTIGSTSAPLAIFKKESSELEVLGNIKATSFAGDGSQLTNLPNLATWIKPETGVEFSIFYNSATDRTGELPDLAAIMQDEDGHTIVRGDGYLQLDAGLTSTSMVMDNNGIGIGTATPSGMLHIRREDVTQGAMVNLESEYENAYIHFAARKHGSTILGDNHTGSIGINDDGGMMYINAGTGASELQIKPGEVEITGNLIINGTSLADDLREIAYDTYNFSESEDLEVVTMEAAVEGGERVRGWARFVNGLNNFIGYSTIQTLSNMQDVQDNVSNGAIFQGLVNGTGLDLSFLSPTGSFSLGALNANIQLGPAGSGIGILNGITRIQGGADISGLSVFEGPARFNGYTTMNNTLTIKPDDDSSYAIKANGPVHISKYESENNYWLSSVASLDDASLFVEEGIATEDMTYIFKEDWDEWPDYVFDENYELSTLDDLEAYIKSNNHLPGVITQQEVKSNGVSDKQMSITLLEKIEELTLYTIAQDNELQAQKELNANLLKRLEALESRVNSNTNNK